MIAVLARILGTILGGLAVVAIVDLFARMDSVEQDNAVMHDQLDGAALRLANHEHRVPGFVDRERDGNVVRTSRAVFPDYT